MKRPEDIWPVEEGYLKLYTEHCDYGHRAAKRSKLAIVAIARTAMPNLANTLMLVDELVTGFDRAAMYVYENDSADDTAAVLDNFAADRPWVTVEHDTLGEADTRGFEPDRTIRLAKCRNRCHAWVAANAPDSQYVLVLDLDPHGGFSTAGILNSIGWLAEYSSATRSPVAGMASYSLFCHRNENGEIGIAQYDAWAMRLNWWEDRRDAPGGMKWAHMLMPPVGSPPIPMNSAFGGACVYHTEAFLAPGVEYVGGDCEHVGLHRKMRQAGYQLYLNPGSRYVAILP